ncbi:MAG TPA: SgcJ/EcaC family oxidoreductase [Gemmatimonadaceae bacterium]|nr:SgcJ/EcaC family oxidoreductase [Gemmatimonadaceae bacterium]
MRPTLLPMLVVALVVAGCAPASETRETPAAATVDVAALRDTIQAREREWSAAFQAGDPAAVAALYTDDAAQVQPVGEWVRGREAITASMKKQLDTLNVITREDITEEVIPAGDYVVEVGHYSYTATSKPGNKPVSGAGRYMVLWRKDSDGQWRLLRDIGTEAPKTP